VNLRAKLFLFLIGLIATLVLLANVVINRVVVEEAKERLAQQLAASEPVYRAVLETRTRLLAGAIASIAGTDYVKRVLGLLYAAPDPTAARETVRDLARDLLGSQLDQAEVLFVADGEGRIVVADTLKARGVTVPAQLPLPLPLHENGRPIIRTGFHLLGSRLFQLASIPVLVQSAEGGRGKVLAILAAGYQVTPEVATSLGKVTLGHVLVFVGSTLYASTLPSDQKPLSHPSRLDEEGRIRKVEVAGTPYMAFVEPLRDLMGQEIGSLILLQSLESAVQTARAIQQWLIILGIGTLLFGGLMSFVLTRAVVTPLERLDRAATELGRGNYDYSIGASGSDEVGRLANTFNQMRTSLQAQPELIQRERLSAIGQTVNSIVHDLRNPLSVIQFRVELLRYDKAVAAQHEKELLALAEAGSRMATMIEELLEFSRGEAQLETVPCPVGKVVEEALGNLGLSWAHQFPIEVQGDMSLKVWADQGKLARALVNLIQNAGEAMEGKGTVEIRAQAVGSMVQLEVADDGPGIPPAIRDRLFEPFVTAGKTGGTGLGLSIVKKVVERHGGQITFQTQSGVGTCFVLELPLAA
jgi:signal transduction histidine kinase